MLSWMVLGFGFVKSTGRGAFQFWGALRLLSMVGLALGFSPLGVDRALAAPLAAAIDKHSDQTSASMPPSLRQALITARQNEAGKEFAWQTGAGKKPAQIRHPQGFRVAAPAGQLQFGAPGQAVGMHLAALQCAGEKRQVLDANRPEPTVKNRRAEYALKGGVTEWYENGPMGLEQGFTLSKPCKNPGELTLEIALTGTKSIQQTGTEAEPNLQITPQDPAQKPYNYSNLYAEDAQGKALKAKMSTKGEKILLTVETAEAQYPIVVDPLVWAQAQKVTADDGKQYDGFGNSVALSGDTAVIGVSKISSQTGAVYVFVKSGDKWIQQQKLVAPDGRGDDYFGRSVAITGDTVVIGAYLADLTASGSAEAGSNLENAGAAYVFVRSGATWSQQSKLVASDGRGDDYFGRSVAITGDTVVIGAYGANLNASGSTAPGSNLENAGAAYVFVRSGAIWSQQRKLVASDGLARDFFGDSVAITGDTVVVGADLADLKASGSTEAGSNLENAGAAYVFVRSAGTWNQRSKLVASDGLERDYFGNSVAITGDTVVIGAFAAGLNASGSTEAGSNFWNAGAAYVFVHSGATWTQQRKLVASDGLVDDYFGNSVAITGDTVVIGSVSASVSTAPGSNLENAGAAYVFVRSGAIWSQQRKLVASDGVVRDFFGNSVAITGDTVVVGASGADLNASGSTEAGSNLEDAGAVYFFHLGKSGGDSCGQQSDCASLSCDQAFKKCGLPGISSCHSDAQCRSGFCKEGVCARAVGDSCGASSDCANANGEGICVDGVCCDSACGGGVAYDCMACSIAKGAAQDGVCGAILRENNHLCQAPAAGQLCDAGAFCDGQGWLCPPDHRMKPAGTECRASQSEGDVPEFCDGTVSSCPADSGRPPVASGCRCEAMAGNNFSLSAWLLPVMILGLTLLRRPRRS